MDGGTPVEAAEDDRMERAGGGEILRLIEDMVEFVRLFAAEMAERDAGQARRGLPGQCWTGCGGYGAAPGTPPN